MDSIGQATQADLVDALSTDGTTLQTNLPGIRAGSNVSWTVEDDGTATMSAADTTAIEKTINLPTTTLTPSETTTFIQRYHVPDGVTFHLESIGIQDENFNAPSALYAEIKDHDTGNVLGTWTGLRKTGDPLASVDGPANIELKMNNQTGNELSPSAWFDYREESK